MSQELLAHLFRDTVKNEIEGDSILQEFFAKNEKMREKFITENRQSIENEKEWGSPYVKSALSEFVKNEKEKEAATREKRETLEKQELQEIEKAAKEALEKKEVQDRQEREEKAAKEAAKKEAPEKEKKNRKKDISLEDIVIGGNNLNLDLSEDSPSLFQRTIAIKSQAEIAQENILMAQHAAEVKNITEVQAANSIAELCVKYPHLMCQLVGSVNLIKAINEGINRGYWAAFENTVELNKILLGLVYQGERTDFLRFAKLWIAVSDYKVAANASYSRRANLQYVEALEKDIPAAIAELSKPNQDKGKVRLTYLTQSSRIRTETTHHSSLDPKATIDEQQNHVSKLEFQSKLHKILHKDIEDNKNDAGVKNLLKNVDVFEFIHGLNEWEENRSILKRYTMTGFKRTKTHKALMGAANQFLHDKDKPNFLNSLVEILTAELVDQKSTLAAVVLDFLLDQAAKDKNIILKKELHEYKLLAYQQQILFNPTRKGQVKRILENLGNADTRKHINASIKEEIQQEFKAGENAADITSKLYSLIREGEELEPVVVSEQKKPLDQQALALYKSEYGVSSDFKYSLEKLLDSVKLESGSSDVKLLFKWNDQYDELSLKDFWDNYPQKISDAERENPNVIHALIKEFYSKVDARIGQGINIPEFAPLINWFISVCAHDNIQNGKAYHKQIHGLYCERVLNYLSHPETDFYRIYTFFKDEKSAVARNLLNIGASPKELKIIQEIANNTFLTKISDRIEKFNFQFSVEDIAFFSRQNERVCHMEGVLKNPEQSQSEFKFEINLEDFEKHVIGAIKNLKASQELNIIQLVPVINGFRSGIQLKNSPELNTKLLDFYNEEIVSYLENVDFDTLHKFITDEGFADARSLLITTDHPEKLQKLQARARKKLIAEISQEITQLTVPFQADAFHELNLKAAHLEDFLQSSDGSQFKFEIEQADIDSKILNTLQNNIVVYLEKLVVSPHEMIKLHGANFTVMRELLNSYSEPANVLKDIVDEAYDGFNLSFFADHRDAKSIFEENVKTLLDQGEYSKVFDLYHLEPSLTLGTYSLTKEIIEEIVIEFVKSLPYKREEKPKAKLQLILKAFGNNSDVGKRIETAYKSQSLSEEIEQIKDMRKLGAAIKRGLNNLNGLQEEICEAEKFSTFFQENKDKKINQGGDSLVSNNEEFFEECQKFLDSCNRKYGYTLNLAECINLPKNPKYIGPTLIRMEGHNVGPTYYLYNILMGDGFSDNVSSEAEKESGYIRLPEESIEEEAAKLEKELKACFNNFGNNYIVSSKETVVSNTINTKIFSHIMGSCGEYKIKFGFEGQDHTTMFDQETKRLNDIKETVNWECGVQMNSVHSIDIVAEVEETFSSHVKFILNLKKELGDEKSLNDDEVKNIITNIDKMLVSRIKNNLQIETLSKEEQIYRRLTVYSAYLRLSIETLQHTPTGKKYVNYLDVLDLLLGNTTAYEKVAQIDISKDFIDTLDDDQRAILKEAFVSHYKKPLEKFYKIDKENVSDVSAWMSDLNQKLYAGLNNNKFNGHLSYLKLCDLLIEDKVWDKKNNLSESKDTLVNVELEFNKDVLDNFDEDQKKCLKEALKNRHKKLLEKYNKSRNGNSETLGAGKKTPYPLKDEGVMSPQAWGVMGLLNHHLGAELDRNHLGYRARNGIFKLTSPQGFSLLQPSRHKGMQKDAKSSEMLQTWFKNAVQVIAGSGDKADIEECMLRLDALHYYQSKLDIQKECKLNAHITQLIKIMEEGLGLYVKEKSRVNSKSAVSKAESYEVLDLSFFLLLEAIEKNPVKQKDLRKELYMWRHQVLRGNEFVPNPNIINEKAKIKFEHLIKELECVKKNHNKWGCALIEMMCSLESEKLAEFVGGLDDPSVNNEIKDKIWAMIRKNLASTKDENLLARLYEAYFSINSENKVDLKNKVSLKNVIRYLKMDVDKGFINMDKGFAASVEHKNNEINNLKAFEVRVGQPKEEIDFLIQALDQVMNTQNKERLGNSIVSMLNSLEDIEFIKFIDEFVSGRYVSQDKKEEFWVRVKESIGEKVGNNNDFLVKLYFACGNDKSGREKRATLSDHAFKIEIFTIDNLKQLEDRKLDWLVLSINSLKNGEADEKGTISAIDTILEHPFISSRTKLGLWQTLANVVLREEPKFKDLQNQLSEKFKMEPIVWAYLLQVFSPDRSKIMERNVNIMCKDGFDKTEETLLNIICKDKNMRGEVRQFLNKIYEGKPYEDESYGKKLFNIVPELKAMIQLGDCLEALACDKEIDKNIGVLTHIILKLQGHDSQAVCSQACNVRAGKMLLDFVEKMQKEINSSWGLCTSKKEILNTINTLFSKDDTTLPNFYIRSFFGDEFEKLDFAFDLNDEVMAKHLIFVAELLVKRASFAYCGENGEQEINASNILKEGTGKKQLKNDFKEGTLGHELLKYISNMLAEIQTKENKMAEGMGFSLH